MDIPESDHQTVANLIAFGSFFVAAIAVIWSLIEGRKTRAIANKANEIAKNATEIANKQLEMSLYDHRVKIEPEVRAQLIHPAAGKKEALFRIYNTKHSPLILTAIEPEGSSFSGYSFFNNQDTLPVELIYRRAVVIKLHLPIYLNEIEMNDTIILISVVDQMKNGYYIPLAYNERRKRFTGRPIEIPN